MNGVLEYATRPDFKLGRAHGLGTGFGSEPNVALEARILSSSRNFGPEVEVSSYPGIASLEFDSILRYIRY